MQTFNKNIDTKNSLVIPTVFEETPRGEKGYDIFSRIMKERIVLLTGEVNDDMAAIAVAQLLFLENEDSSKPIHMYINSPGGSVVSGLAIIDTMNKIKSPVYTYVMGMAASMGAAILSCGEKGFRYALPNATIMTHMVSGGFQGNINDHRVNFKYEEALNARLTKIIATNCNMSIKDYEKSSERDNYMFAEEALKFGIIDQIL